MSKRKGFAIIAISGNEEKWVVQWCQSVMASNPDVVVVNLTQYADNCEALFKEYIPADKLVFMKHPWQKSFSEARNHSIEGVRDWETRTGNKIDYMMFVDLDEIFTKPSYTPLEQVLHSDMVHAQIMVNIYNSVNQESMVASLFYPRMFPWRDNDGKCLNPHFEHEVHNQLVYPSNVELEAVRTQIGLFHYGYALDADKMAEKHKRSEALLWAQLDVDPNDYFAHLNLAQLLRAKGDIDGCIHHAQTVVNIVQARMSDGDFRYRHAFLMAKEQLGSGYLHIGKSDEAIEVSQAGIDTKPDHLDSIMNMANAYLQKQDFENAKFWFKRFLFVRARYDETADNTNLILNHLNSSFMVLYHLGMLAVNDGDLQEALKYLKRSFDEEPAYGDTFVRYIDLLRKTDQHEELGKNVQAFMQEHNAKAYQVYEYFGDVEVEATNLENAKFNYYQATNLVPEGAPEKPRITHKWESLSSVFGPVSDKYFDTSEKAQQMKNRIE